MVKRLPALLLCTAWFIAWWTLYPRLGPDIKAWGLSLLGPTADYFFTYMGPELLIFAFGLVVIPLLYFFVLRRLAYWLQLLLIPTLLASCVFAAYFDVFQIAREAERLCTTEAGMRVYKTVEAEGIYGLHDIRLWSKHGFKWIEYSQEKKYFKETLDEEGVKVVSIDEPQSRYEYRSSPIKERAPQIEVTHRSVTDRTTNEDVADVTYFHIFRGKIDRILNFGLQFIPPICYGGPPVQNGGIQIDIPTDLVNAVVN